MKKQALNIRQGTTFEFSVLWERATFVYKTIEAVAQSAPVRLTVTGHGVPDGWKVAVQNVKVPTDLNAENNPPKDSEFRTATVVSVDEIEFNAINGAGFKAYTTGGQIAYYQPGDLSGAEARMKIKNKLGGTVLYELSSTIGNILLDVAKARVTIVIEDDETEAFSWTSGVYDLEVEDALGKTYTLLYGEVAVTREVTTTA